MILPLLILVFMFSYLPLYGWIYALFDYKPGVALFDNRFVGMENFTKMFKDLYYFEDIIRVLKNTLGMNLIGMLTSPLPMLFAVFLSEIKWGPFKKLSQTLTTIPNFISWVLVYAVAYAMFSVNDGFVNKVLINLNLIDEGINFLASSDHIWLKMWLWGQWKGLGWSAIVYIAAISGIDHEQYEAAEVDGANRFQKMRYVTIPGLLPTYFVLLILSIGNMINNGMDQYFVFQNAMNKEHIEVLDLYVYNQGMVGINYSYSTAVSVLKSIVSVTLLFISNQMSRLARDESVF
ncbi:MAG: sugar ABC transporter permease [Lachnospiraceae bacterium]|nr:sugar ABC transporter permease [Lachnospiraceae bacterium]